MSNLETRCLDAFANWLSTLGRDALALSEELKAEATPPLGSSPNPEAVAERRAKALGLVAGSLNYLFKSLDLIQDGIEDVGYLDDCFVLRVCAKLALPEMAGQPDTLVRLADDAEVIREFLGDEDYARLERYSDGTRKLKARGRNTEEIVNYEDARESFIEEIRAWAASYAAPSFTKDEKNLVRLRSFLATKLPS